MYIWNKTCRSPKIFKSSFLNFVLIQRAINKLHLKVNPDWCHHQIIEGITSQSTSRLLDSAFRQIMDHDNSQRNQRRMQRKTFQNKIILVTWSLKSYHQSVIERKESPLNLFFAITRPWKQMISKLSSLLAFSKLKFCSLASEVKVTRNFKMMLSSYGTQNLPHWYCRKWLNMISCYLWFAICITSESHVVNFWNLKPISHSYLNRFSHETRTHFRSR